MTQLIFILWLGLTMNQQDSCKSLTINSDKFSTPDTLRIRFALKGFGQIPIDSIYHRYEDNSPFKIENDCLSFTVSHMGCDYSYDLVWDGKFRNDHNKTIANIEFFLSYTDPCKVNNTNHLKYDLSEIINRNKDENLYLNFIGYNKLIKVK